MHYGCVALGLVAILAAAAPGGASGKDRRPGGNVTSAVVLRGGGGEGRVPFYFIAGVEGTGHHWFQALAHRCGSACVRSWVGFLGWQRAVAGFRGSSGASSNASSSASSSAVGARVGAVAAALAREAAAAEVARGRASPAIYFLNSFTHRGASVEDYHKEVHARFAARGEKPPWRRKNVGMQSYPSFGGDDKAAQMPAMGAFAEALDLAGSPESQLRVVLATRAASLVARSNCERRHFAGGKSAFQARAAQAGGAAHETKRRLLPEEAGDDGGVSFQPRDEVGCERELRLLAAAADVIADQIEALPPAPAAVCEHFAFEDLTTEARPAVARLSAYLRLDGVAALARYVNAQHAKQVERRAQSPPPPPEPPKTSPTWTPALARALLADLDAAQRRAVAACAKRPSSSASPPEE